MNRIILLLIFLISPALLIASEKYKILYIIDGDTIVIDYIGSKERVRLIGIDTPEAKPNQKAMRDSLRQQKDVDTIVAEGKKASKYVKSILKKGDYVILEFDVEKRDQYGRLLAYVYLSDGQMLNDLIVAAGYASLMTIPPNVKYQAEFRKSYIKAREAKIGLWADEN